MLSPAGANWPERAPVFIAFAGRGSPFILKFSLGRQARLHTLNLHYLQPKFKLRKALDSRSVGTPKPKSIDCWFAVYNSRF